MECKYTSYYSYSSEPDWINRYIMECKFSGNHIPHTGIYELIDTLWNVNVDIDVNATDAEAN